MGFIQVGQVAYRRSKTEFDPPIGLYIQAEDLPRYPAGEEQLDLKWMAGMMGDYIRGARKIEQERRNAAPCSGN